MRVDALNETVFSAGLHRERPEADGRWVVKLLDNLADEWIHRKFMCVRAPPCTSHAVHSRKHMAYTLRTTPSDASTSRSSAAHDEATSESECEVRRASSSP